jgi:hypothetical protein
VCSYIRLAGTAHEAFTLFAGRQRFGLLSKPSGLFGQSFFKGSFVLDAASFHDAILLTLHRKHFNLCGFPSSVSDGSNQAAANLGSFTALASEGRSSKSDRVSQAVRRLLQDAVSHLRFDGFGFGAIRQSGPCFIKDRS